MEQDLKRLVKEIINQLISEEIPAYSPNGGQTFRGGPFGTGNKRQLANPLDPSVQALEDMEQAEINQNVEDQASINRNLRKGGPAHMQDIHSSPELERDMQAAKKYDPIVERNQADQNYTDLPGFPAHNALEAPVQHVPNENLPVDTNRRGSGQDGTEEYIVDDIIDELERGEIPSQVRKEDAMGTSGGLRHQRKPALPPFYVDPEAHKDELGHMQQPGAENSPPATHGSVLFPKQFVPDETPQESGLVDLDNDGIDDSIDLNQSPELRQRVSEMKTEAKRQKHKSNRSKERYGVKPPSGAQILKKFKDARQAVIELIETLDASGLMVDADRRELILTVQLLRAIPTHMPELDNLDEAAVDEEYKSKAQQGYFHAKAAEGDPEFKDLAAEFDADTSPEEFKNLPARAPKREAFNSDAARNLVKEELLKELQRSAKK
jgi:hypothetical protein